MYIMVPFISITIFMIKGNYSVRKITVELSNLDTLGIEESVLVR